MSLAVVLYGYFLFFSAEEADSCLKYAGMVKQRPLNLKIELGSYTVTRFKTGLDYLVHLGQWQVLVKR